MKIPSNIIKENQYTIGNEFIYADSYQPYQGYYYQLNNSFFTGKEFNINAPLLLKLNSNQINPLRLNPSTSTYSKLKNLNIIFNSKIPSIPFNNTDGIKYITKHINSNPIKIIFTTEEIFNKANQYPEYIFTKIEYNIYSGFIITEENKKAIPEIDIFLQEYSLEGILEG